MGAHNVKQVYEHWSTLDHRPHRLLAYMALTSLDSDSPPRYWAGRDKLAEALGYPMPEAPEDEDASPEAEAARKLRATGHNAVKKATSELLKAGALTRLHPGNFRTNATFALVLPEDKGTREGSPTQRVEGSPQRSPRGPVKGLVGDPSEVLEGTPQRSPYEYEEKKRSFRGMSRQHSPGAKVRPTVKTLMNDSQSSIENERARQMQALQSQIDAWGNP